MDTDWPDAVERVEPVGLVGAALRAAAGDLRRAAVRLERLGRRLDAQGHLHEASLVLEREACTHHVAAVLGEWAAGIEAIERRTGVTA